ncbi:type II toxin-antitoxin system VapC family toxin [Capnocytophaga canimorsus]|uniref:type II toxin-antitoxin system VapC family toxin n=1 Tax=Capnocytophaga canimorsus TaxID=28188 RepID=UPI00385D98C5
MRYLLDTNIVIYLVTGQDISKDVLYILEDYGNLFYISSLSFVELKHLYEAKKIKTKYKSFEQMCKTILEESNLIVLHTKDEHLATYTKLSIVEEKTDLIDRFIISQAITEKMPLISSDRAFENYTPQKLKFVYNKR